MHHGPGPCGGHKLLFSDIGEAVRIYNSECFTSASEIVWDSAANAPGNDAVRLRSVRLRPSGNACGAAVNIADGCAVEIEYELLPNKCNRLPIAAIQLLNASGVILFAIADFHEGQQRKPGFGCKYCRSVCHIPGGLLAEGRHSVLVAMVNYNPNIVHAMVPDAISFEAKCASTRLRSRCLFP